MVATWSVAASSAYYSKRGAYYLDGQEPPGHWYAPAGDLELVDRLEVEPDLLERLFEAIDDRGKSMLSTKGGKLERSPAFDITFSAPRSVSLAWAFASNETKLLIELAQERAVRTALSVLEREATYARRGKNGSAIEKVPLSAAIFQHGESRPAEHEDGRRFGDCNLHHHAVCLSLSTRPSDKTIGGLHSIILRNSKMLAGVVFHAQLSHELQRLGFSIDRIGRNGIFELSGVSQDSIRYFSARRAEIESELSELGVTSAEAVALAASIAKNTRSAKARSETASREEIWAEAARANGIDVENFTEQLRDRTLEFNREAAEQMLEERLAALPRLLTEHESVIERPELLRSVTEALVGTGLPAERATSELDRLLRDGAFVEIGRDPLLLPRYSTPEMIAIEREIVVRAQALSTQSGWSLDSKEVTARCNAGGLSAEQTTAVLAATGDSAVAIVEGSPGVGKNFLISKVAESYQARGFTVAGGASAWRVANALRDSLGGIESRSVASWIQMSKSGKPLFNDRTLFIIDEAGLLSSRDTIALLDAIAPQARSSADPTGYVHPEKHAPLDCKILWVGDRRQLQPINAGGGLSLISRSVEASRVDTIVRQFEPWTRDAIRDFGVGRAQQALEAFAEHGLVIEASGSKAAIAAIADKASHLASISLDKFCLILAKTNAEVSEISKEIRKRRRAAGLIFGEEVRFAAATASGRPTELTLAAGDKIRFLARNDVLRTINGTVAEIKKVALVKDLFGVEVGVRIDADIEGRRISFNPAILADAQGRARIGWAYASTIASSQGQTVDQAVVLLGANFNRHEMLVATSRSRNAATIVIDNKAVDRRLLAENPVGRQGDHTVFTQKERRDWLSKQISRASPKISTLDVIESSHSSTLSESSSREHTLGHDLDHEL